MALPLRQLELPGFGEEAPSAAPPPAVTPPMALPSAAAAEPADLTGQTVYVIDSHSLIYQVFHALPEMSSPSGQPVGAIHGFLRDVVDLLQRHRPDYLFCAFDYPREATFRHELYPEYKAHREAMPDDLRPQIPAIHRLLEAIGVPTLQIAGYEADDIVATIAARTAALHGNCVIISTDKDCRQLLGDHVRVLNLRKGEFYDAAALWNDWGVRPDQVVDFQSLVGDAVDNVPGVPLIGPKAARELLEKYGTLDQVLDHAHEVSQPKRRENLIQYRDQALVSRQLVRLCTDVPIAIDWRAGRRRDGNREAVLELCREFGFRRLADQLGKLLPGGDDATAAVATSDPPPSTPDEVQDERETRPPVRSDSAPTGEALAAFGSDQWQGDYRVVATLDELRAIVAEVCRAGRVSFDTETTSAHPRQAELVGCSLAWQPGQAWYVPFRTPWGEPTLPLAESLAVLRPLLEDSAIAKCGQNIKFDVIVLRAAGIALAGVAFDTMVADYLLEAGERSHSLDELARRYLGFRTTSISQLIGAGKKQRGMWEVPLSLIGPYACQDADLPLRLMEQLDGRLAAQGLTPLFRELELPLIDVLADLEFVGIRVDAERCRDLGRRFAARMEQLAGEIYALAGGEFNIDSPKQLARVLFERLKLPVTKRTATGPSTDAEVLDKLAEQHPLPARVREYRQFAKLKSTYCDALPALVHPTTGRVHTSFKQDVAATGRLSSTDPNLQNIPVRTAEGREIRAAFLPGEPGWRLLSADYSQIELRMLAHFSGDAALCQAFAEDRDIHTQVAAEVNHVPLADVTRDMRRQAKAINFGVIYGQSPAGLAKALGISKPDAARFIASYFARYTGVEQFIQRLLADCRQRGYVETILGRRRVVRGLREPAAVSDPHQRNLPERIAINTVIQGSAADLIKRAMICVHRRLRDEGLSARMLLQIHDELLFEFPPAEFARLHTLVVEEMARAGSLSVPLRVDVKVGDNWAECEPIE